MFVFTSGAFAMHYKLKNSIQVNGFQFEFDEPR